MAAASSSNVTDSSGQGRKENQASKESLKSFHDDFIKKMPLGPNNTPPYRVSDEIVDVVTDFPWTASPIVGGTSGTSFSHNIPYCYVIERQQTVNSNIANFINTLKIGIDSVLDTSERVASKLGVSVDSTGTDSQIVTNDEARNNTQTETASKGVPSNGTDDTNGSGGKKQEDMSTAEKIKSGAESLLKTISSIKDQYETYVGRFLSGVVSDQLSSKLLSPYRYLYYTAETGKKFIFPMLTPTQLLNVTNNFGSDTKSFDFGGIGEFAKKAAETLAGGQMIMNFLDQLSSGGYNNSNGGRNMEEMYAEMAKSFSFNPDGQELSITFPLYNTVSKGAWNNNYRFIQGFVLRNLPFKVSSYSYKPPFLYDIIVPGTTHLPLCYVSSIDIQSYGLIRMLKMKNWIKDLVNYSGAEGSSVGGDSELHVPVPEAWLVNIKFKCLLSNSANLMLDLANSPINITVNDVSARSEFNYRK